MFAGCFLFLLFTIVWCCLRLPWLGADSGVPSLWEYGYHATDEGYYLDGGKEKYLFSRFYDADRRESYSYGFSAGTHLLSWAAHLAFGLSTWGWRVPFLLINFIAWAVLFRHLARRIGAVYSFLLCMVVTCTPLIVAYERTASNDVLIGSLLLLAYVVATGRRVWRIPAAALLGSAIVLVKPSVYVLLPIVLCGILSRRKTRAVWLDAALFVGCSAVFVLLFRGVVHLLIRPDAVEQGMTMTELVKRTTTHYPLPSLLDIGQHLKGLSCFPRTPSGVLLGVWSAILVVFPAVMLFRRVFDECGPKGWDWRMLLYVLIPGYVAAVSVMNTLYTHYFIPAIMMFPLVWVEMRKDLRRDRGDGGKPFSARNLLAGGCMVAVCILGMLVIRERMIAPQNVQDYYSLVYNFPAKNVWGFNWGMGLSLGAALIVLGTLLGWGRWTVWRFAGFVSAVTVCMSVAFAQLPAYYLAPFTKGAIPPVFGTLSTVFASGVLFICIVFFFSRYASDSRKWFTLPACLFAASLLASPVWQAAFRELVTIRTHHNNAAAAQFVKLLPQDAGQKHLLLSRDHGKNGG